jgi:RND family efflux transporter MFP subunit
MAAQIRLGQAVKVHVQALDDDFTGKVSRFADSLDMQTRTMETEIDVPNRNGRLMPGMYTETQLSLREKKDVLTIPLEGVTRNGEVSTVLLVNPQGVVEERNIQLGIEDASQTEVLSGLSQGDMVIVGNRSSFHAGEKVEPKEIGSAPRKAEGQR